MGSLTSVLAACGSTTADDQAGGDGGTTFAAGFDGKQALDEAFKGTVFPIPTDAPKPVSA
ncbi:hypothetical protein [Aeromicrobium endophyticum]|uniref:hypothetical protein n=1 Tax=Aeromicrobium endophyticum TaxID=2292704 RepID=UPI0011C34778|nr:hypothetical protein [Aeromicrobium endophyticum]